MSSSVNSSKSDLSKSDLPKATRRGPGRPRDTRNADLRREAILDAATSEFAQNGYQSTDVQEIADRLQVAKGTIYHYFGSKEALFLAAVDRGMTLLSSEINSSVQTLECPIEKIARAIRAFLGFFDRHPEMVELIVQERAEFRDRKKPTYLVHREKNIKPWHELFDAMAETGRFRQLNADETTQTISNLLYGTIFTTYFARQGASFESRARQVLTLVFAGLLSDDERGNLEKYVTV